MLTFGTFGLQAEGEVRRQLWGKFVVNVVWNCHTRHNLPVNRCLGEWPDPALTIWSGPNCTPGAFVLRYSEFSEIDTAELKFLMQDICGETATREPKNDFYLE